MAYFQEAADELLTNSAIKLSILFNREYRKLKKTVKSSLQFSYHGIFGICQGNRMIFLPISDKDYLIFKIRNLSTSEDITDYCNIYFQNKLDKFILKGDSEKIQYYQSLLDYKGPQY